MSTGTDVYGMPNPVKAVVEKCAIVKMVIVNEKSSVRADTSASRGNARELEANAIILLTKDTKANIDDAIIVGGNRLRIISMFPRYDLQGVLDHHEITCAYWISR
jgi:hypothetical protein